MKKKKSQLDVEIAVKAYAQQQPTVLQQFVANCFPICSFELPFQTRETPEGLAPRNVSSGQIKCDFSQKHFRPNNSFVY